MLDLAALSSFPFLLPVGSSKAKSFSTFQILMIKKFDDQGCFFSPYRKTADPGFLVFLLE